MSATRETFRSTTGGPVDGNPFLNQVSDNIKKLYDQSTLVLTNVAGVDTVTADVSPDFDADGLTAGAKFTVTWAADNTGPVTLALNSEPAAPVVDADGNSLSASALIAGRRSLIEYTGSEFRLLTQVNNVSFNLALRAEIIDVSGTWVVPSGVTRAKFTVFGAAQGGYEFSSSGTMPSGNTSVVGANVNLSVGPPPAVTTSIGVTIASGADFVARNTHPFAQAPGPNGKSGGVAEKYALVSGSYTVTISAGGPGKDGQIDGQPGKVLIEYIGAA